ncbi:hypothetical protein [Cardinium endosymbiont of Tipula unca]|uniref:hypothetical protein n=1 Tax=Cardinium endosymbiont of Tipula unca TaxID=3066216 RepID=UPI0030D50468
MLIFSIRLLVKIVVLATCTKACFLSQKVYCFHEHNAYFVLLLLISCLRIQGKNQLLHN